MCVCACVHVRVVCVCVCVCVCACVRECTLPSDQTSNLNNLKQNEAQSTPAESTHNGADQLSIAVTQTQQQTPELPTVNSDTTDTGVNKHKTY